MTFTLEGRRALVTGASRGIGRAIALSYAAAGADVALLARDEQRLGEVAAEIGALGRRAVVCPADVLDGDSVRAARMLGRGHHHRRAECTRDGFDPLIVGRDDNFARPCRTRAFVHPLDHRLTGDRCERLAGQTRRGVASGNDDAKHARVLQRAKSGSSTASVRASSSSITGMPSTIGKARRSARQTKTFAAR